MSSSSSSAFSSCLDQLSPSSEQLCYVQCNLCDTVLAVSVPCSSLFKTVTVRCGHCTNLLSVNMRGLLLPAAAAAASTNQHQLHQLGSHSFFSPNHNNFLEEITSPAAAAAASLLLDHQANANNASLLVRGGGGLIMDDLPRPPIVNRPPEKRQRVPSAYNRFIKDEIQRIKAGNPDISHREAFSAAAKNWAHFPHIHFGLMPDQAAAKKSNVRHQEAGDDLLMKDGGFFAAAATAAAANLGVSPY